MKNLLVILSTLLLKGSIIFCQTENTDFSNLTEPYFGQKSPGIIPEVFAKGIVSLDESIESRCIIWEDGTKILLGRSNAGFIESELINGRWTPFVKTNIFRDHDHLQENVSPDGKRIFFNKFKLNPNVRGGMDVEIWVVEKEGDNWNEPEYTGKNGMYPYVDKQGNLYYTTALNGKMCIGISLFQNNKYSDTPLIPNSLVSDKGFCHPCVDPDGKWIIVNTEKQKYFENGNGLFISFKKSNNEWTKPVRFGAGYINATPLMTVSSDGKYLFYSSKGDIYWVSSKIIDDLRPEE